jgi:hypothetical protein
VGSWPNILFYAVTLEQPKCRPASPLAINSFVYYANTSLATQVLNCVEHCAAWNLFCRRAEPPSDAQSPRNDRILQIVRSHGHIRGQDQPITHLLHAVGLSAADLHQTCVTRELSSRRPGNKCRADRRVKHVGRRLAGQSTSTQLQTRRAGRIWIKSK